MGIARLGMSVAQLRMGVHCTVAQLGMCVAQLGMGVAKFGMCVTNLRLGEAGLIWLNQGWVQLN